MEFDYQQIIQRAFLNVVKEILTDIAEQGLPDPHHFYITFRTQAPYVNIPSFLKEQYPEEMTIVIQHQFQNLAALDTHFVIDLSFQGQFHTLSIPYTSLVSFIDPSAQFALQFTPALYEEKKEPPVREETAEVIDLNALRNKK